MGYRIAVVGATGNVGREMLNILSERLFPADEVVALASGRSNGREVSFGDGVLKVQDLSKYNFDNIDIALFSAGSKVAEEWAPKAAAAGAMVIDNSSFWRYDIDVPLIVPEVNPNDIDRALKKRIIANPNCSTAQLVVALKPLHDVAKIKRVIVSTYQSVSGAGNQQWTSYSIKQEVFLLMISPHQRSLLDKLLLMLFLILIYLWKMDIQKKNGRW